jgi:peptide/nickel transport system substrate-binding protein
MDRPVRDQLIDLDLGKADVIELAPADSRRAAQRGIRVWSSQPSELLALVFEHGKPALEDARLREAIARSIDRTAIHSVLLQRQGEPAAGLLPQWLSGYAFLFSAGPDLERARRLSAAIAKPGERYSLSYAGADPLARAVAERIALNARDAGISIQTSTRAGGTDMRVARIFLESHDPGQALYEAAASLGLGDLLDAQPPLRPEELYTVERRLIETFRAVPIAHLPQIYGFAPRVNEWPGFRRDELHLEDAWIEASRP